MMHSATVATVGAVVLLLIVSLAVALLAQRLRFPYTLALVLAGLLIGILHVGPTSALNPDVVLFLFLPALLFEAAWNIETARLRADALVIGLLAVPGLLISLAVITAVTSWGAHLPLLTALLLGTIVSPTDPIAVVALLKQVGMPARLRAIIEGESLFNDGVGAAAFELVLGVLLLSLHNGGPLTGLSMPSIILKGIWLLGGGVLLGTAIGYAVSHLVRVVDEPLIETTVTFSVAYGSYIVGVLLGTSGLLTVVAAGLTLGSYGRRVGMTQRTQVAVDNVWAFTGYLANSLLFVLVGVALGRAPLLQALSVIGWAVLGVVAGRALMIYMLVPLHGYIVTRRRQHRRMWARPAGWVGVAVFPVWRPLLLFAGLRGALSLALVLSLPAEVPQRELLRLVVYGIVLVTLLGQGIALRVLLPHWPQAKHDEPRASEAS